MQNCAYAQFPGLIDHRYLYVMNLGSSISSSHVEFRVCFFPLLIVLRNYLLIPVLGGVFVFGSSVELLSQMPFKHLLNNHLIWSTVLNNSRSFKKMFTMKIVLNVQK